MYVRDERGEGVEEKREESGREAYQTRRRRQLNPTNSFVSLLLIDQIHQKSRSETIGLLFLFNHQPQEPLSHQLEMKRTKTREEEEGKETNQLLFITLQLLSWTQPPLSSCLCSVPISDEALFFTPKRKKTYVSSVFFSPLREIATKEREREREKERKKAHLLLTSHETPTVPTALLLLFVLVLLLRNGYQRRVLPSGLSYLSASEMR